MAWMKDGKMYSINCAVGDVGRYVLLPGDPFRTDIIAAYLDDAELVAHNREHKTWTGTLMESSALFVLSTIRECRAGAICAYPDLADPAEAVNKTIETACEALRIIIKKDKETR